MKQMDAVSVVGRGCQCESYVALRRPRWWHCPMLTMRADSCPARLKPPTPASPCSSRVAPASSQRWVDRMRYRASGAPHGLSTAHDGILNGRRARAPWTWLRLADLVSGTVDVWFHVKHDRVALSLRAPSPDRLALGYGQ